ncbi:BUB3-interacting and GLEBS motif-containing protein ZNF207-like, partial [Corvus hawaiiensis]|uniref:BUB3-interacting and GLEBS motif-containing protein ZNF207-like n=1 Tax=Corvus hawaiiensis TaxID=134902 RepID=UPI002019EA71
ARSRRLPARVSNGEAGGDSHIRNRTWKRESICRGERFSFPEVEPEVIYDDVPCEGLEAEPDGPGPIGGDGAQPEPEPELGWSSSDFESYSDGESGDESRREAEPAKQRAAFQPKVSLLLESSAPLGTPIHPGNPHPCSPRYPSFGILIPAFPWRKPEPPQLLLLPFPWNFLPPFLLPLGFPPPGASPCLSPLLLHSCSIPAGISGRFPVLSLSLPVPAPSRPGFRAVPLGVIPPGFEPFPAPSRLEFRDDFSHL